MSDFIGVRLNLVKDADIIADLKKYKSRTDRLKEVYRLVIALENKNIGEAMLTYMKSTPPMVASEVNQREQKSIVWNFPKEPTVKDVKPIDTPKKDRSSLKANILSNDF